MRKIENLYTEMMDYVDKYAEIRYGELIDDWEEFAKSDRAKEMDDHPLVRMLHFLFEKMAYDRAMTQFSMMKTGLIKEDEVF